MATEEPQPETTDQPRSPTCVWSVVESFLKWCGQTGKKANSLKQYRTRLQPLKEKFDRREFSTLTAIEIDDWLAEQSTFDDGRPKSPDTIRITVISVNLLHQYALNKKAIKERIFEKLHKPTGRKRKRLPKPNEIELIVKHSSPEFARIVRAFQNTGARPMELAGAKFEHWNRERKLIILKEHKTDKTGEDRIIPVGKKVLPILLEATAGRDSGHLFLTPRGVPWSSATLTQTFTRARIKAGLAPGLILYLIRHKVATEVCKKRGIHAAKSLLGHKSIKTTEGYVHDEDADLLANQDAIGDDAPDPDPPAPPAP